MLRTKLTPEQLSIRAKCYHPSGSFMEFNKEELEQSIADRFRKIATKYPERLAIEHEERAFTYDQLNKASNRTAHAILSGRENGVEPIALLFEPGVEVVAALLGVLKAGKIYVPLEPFYPPERLACMLEDSTAKLVITNSKNVALAQHIGGSKINIINIDEMNSKTPDMDLALPISPYALAYILYTSGSSGQPKGVMQNHRNVLHNTMIYSNHLHICPEDRLSFFQSYAYGASINNLFGALLSGATLVVFDVRTRGTSALSEFIIEKRISIYHSVPSVFRDFVRYLGGQEEFDRLRVLHLSGAPACRSDVELYKRYFAPHCIFLHRLGSTEANTVFLNFIDKHSDLPGNVVPVGFPVDDKEVFLWDENEQKVSYGFVGEIVIQSSYLSPGYWRDAERTQSTFPASSNGEKKRIFYTGDLGRILPAGFLEHVGRKDSRVKIKGHRIEILEIEMAILNHGKIKEVAVVPEERGRGEQELIAYVVPWGDPVPTAGELRRFLCAALPSYMIPSVFIFVDGLPLLPNSKLDRSALSKLARNGSQPELPYLAPRTPVEKILGSIWTEALGVEQLGVKDNFFDLGGCSLVATRIVSVVQDRLQVRLKMRDLFDHPTIEELALTITEHLAREEGHMDLQKWPV